MDKDIYSWLALKMVEGLGNRAYMRLLGEFASPAAVLAGDVCRLCSVRGVSEELARRIAGFDRKKDVEGQIEMVRKAGIRVVTVYDDDYPCRLKEIHDPPPFLYVKGELLKRDDISIAIVGTRIASNYGVMAARELSGNLAGRGFTVVSGLARGIDTVVHEAALARGRTIAVLGSGLLNIYPPENRRLAEKISQNGAVISEFFPEAAPEAFHFPVRNRIISGITLGTLVIEANERSGSLITARLAMEQNREVFAVPGNINTAMSKGTNKLIKQGAKLVQTADDIIEELRHILPNEYHASKNNKNNDIMSQFPPELSGDERLIYDKLKTEAMYIDELVMSLQMEANRIAALLLTMELKGLVTKGRDGLFESC